MSTTAKSPVEDPRFIAAVDLVGRTGAKQFQIRWSDDEDPMIWMAVAIYRDAHECAAGMDPLKAVLRLADQLVDGGTCAHCRRASGVSDHWESDMPLNDVFCWYVFDPETKKYRRSCEGEAKVGRNEPCPCGSGKKFKHCHGSGP